MSQSPYKGPIMFIAVFMAVLYIGIFSFFARLENIANLKLPEYSQRSYQ